MDRYVQDPTMDLVYAANVFANLAGREMLVNVRTALKIALTQVKGGNFVIIDIKYKFI